MSALIITRRQVFYRCRGQKKSRLNSTPCRKPIIWAGWRVGVAAGNPEIIRLLRMYKSQMDSSLFKPVMQAAETALLGDQTWIEGRNQVYQQRRDLIVTTLREIGFELEVPKASLYVWAHLPEPWTDSVQFCDTLIRQTGVSITPGVVYGESGAGFVRVSLVTACGTTIRSHGTYEEVDERESLILICQNHKY